MEKLELPKRTLFCDTLGSCCQVTDKMCKKCEFYKETFKRTKKDILEESERLLKKYEYKTECKISKMLTKGEAVQIYFNIISEMIFLWGGSPTPDDYLSH